MNRHGRRATGPRLRTSFALCLLLTGGLLFISGLPSSANEGPAEVKIAFIGDQSLSAGARAVLQLIASEGTDAVLHNGDFDYQDDPAAWDAQIDAFLGPDFPYFASVGNHDDGQYYGVGGYQEVLEARMNRLGIPWDGDLGVQSSFEWQGIFFVLTGAGVFGAGDGFHDLYIRDQLAVNESIWRISGWHENMRLMQVGGKGNSTGWGVYEESRRGGAIITTGHSHTYSRSHLLTSTELQEVADTSNQFVIAEDDPVTPEDEGRSFVVVSGVAGRGIRGQQRDDPWWASIYTQDQNAEFGALFGVFNEGGVANRARFYFKNTLGEVIDEFFVTSAVNASLEPTLLSEDVAVAEGDAGSQDAEVHVVLLSPDGTAVSVDYATADGEATASADYEATAGRLDFAPGETQQTIRVPIHGDSVDEGDESFSVDFSNPLNAALPYTSSTVTILDDDLPPLATLTVSSGAGGTVELDPPGGSYAPGTQVTLTALPAAGYLFEGWSGDLGGSANPQSLVMDGDRAVAAHFVVSAPVLHEVQSGGSSDASSVATDLSVTAADGHLYLAAIASKPHAEATAVSGLGLSWTPVAQQCAGRGQTGSSVWQASGTPTGDEVVTATFPSSVRNAVISVFRYEGSGGLGVTHVASANSTGQAGACDGGVDGASYGLDLDVSAAGSIVYLAVAMRGKDHLPGPGFVEQTELYQGPLGGNRVGLSIAEASAGPPPSMSVAGDFSGSVDWAAVALEIHEPRFFDLTSQTTPRGSLTLDPPGGTYLEGSVVTLTATADPGFVFLRWAGDVPPGQGNPAQLPMDDHKLAIGFFVPGFEVTVAPVAGGSVALAPAPEGLYPRGTVATITATPDPGFAFADWTGDVPAGQGNPAFFVVDGDKNVGASFLPLFAVQLEPTTDGSIALDPPGGVYPSGTTVTLTATPDPGFALGAWSGDIAAEQGSPVSLLVDADKLVGASFVPGFAVGIAPPSGGSIALDPSGGFYTSGTTVTLTATPDPGFLFSAWSGDVPAGQGNPASLLVDADKLVGASFLPGFAVDVEPASGGSVSLEPPATGLYPEGTVVTATATPDEGYVFAGWSGDLAGQPNPASVASEALVVAQFVAAQPELEEIATGSSGGFTVVATTTPLAAADGDLYVAAISTKPNLNVASVSGLGLTWTPVRSQCSGRRQTGVSIWQARGQPSGSGIVTATLSSVPSNAVIAVSRYSGSPTVGGVVSGNSLGLSGACSGGQDGSSYAFDLDTTAAKSVVYVAVAARRRDHLPGPGFVEHLQIYQGTSDGDKVGLSIAESPVDGPARVNVTGSTDAAVDWAVISIEIRGPIPQQ